MRALLVVTGVQELHALTGVVLPVQDGLVVYEFAALAIDDLLAEILVLQQIQEVQAHGVSEGEHNITCCFITMRP